MDQLGGRDTKQHRFIWDQKFTVRQELSHRSEDAKLVRKPYQTIVQAFLDADPTGLDPPQYNCTALKSFLEQADEADLTLDPPVVDHAKKLVLIDDRQDPTGWRDHAGEHRAARDWDGYAMYPPEGIKIQSSILTAGELHRKLQANVSITLSSSVKVLYFKRL